MFAPSCTQFGTTMQPTTAIGTGGYYCPSPECSASNGVQYQLNYAITARAVCRMSTVYLQNPICCGRPTTWDVLRASYVCGVCHSAQ